MKYTEFDKRIAKIQDAHARSKDGKSINIENTLMQLFIQVVDKLGVINQRIDKIRKVVKKYTEGNYQLQVPEYPVKNSGQLNEENRINAKDL